MVFGPAELKVKTHFTRFSVASKRCIPHRFPFFTLLGHRRSNVLLALFEISVKHMPKIRVTCTDPYATDCSSDDDDDDESIEEYKPKIGGLFVKEISVALPIIIPTISTLHFDSLAKLKLDSSFRVHESESSGDRRNCVVLALPVRKSEDILRRKSGIFSVQNRFQKLSMAKKGQVDASNSSSREDISAKATPTSIDMTVDIPVAKNSKSPGASKHPPGLRLTALGKWGVQIWNPFKRAKTWLGTYSTVEEATKVYNKKKLEYASLRSETCKEDASFRVDKLKSFVDESNYVVLALSATEPEDSPRKKSDILSVHNTLEKLSTKNQEASSMATSVAVDIPVDKISRCLESEKNHGLKLTTSGKYGVQIQDPITRSRIWLGTYSTFEEAKNIYNEKKLKYTSSRSEIFMEDASFRVDEPKLSVDGSNCVILALSARGTEDTPRKKSGRGLEKLPMAQKCQLESKTSRSLSAEKHPGLKLTKSGKYGVQIQDPITRSRIWLGTYSTIEEAKSVYNKKNLEYASSLRPTVIKHKKHSILKAKRKGKGKRKRQKLVIQGISVWETVSGKWGVSVRDPVSKLKVWLGSHVTPEEAVKSYHRKMLEFDSSYNCHSVGKEAVNGACIPAGDVADTGIAACDVSAGDVSETCTPDCDVSNRCIPASDVVDTCVPVCYFSNEYIPAHDVDSLVATNITDVEHPVVKLTNAEKWRVSIRHPMLKNSLSLGSYDTAEEAEQVYNRNKLELDAVLHSDKFFGSPTAVGSDEGVGVKKYKGVRTNGNGRWWSQIVNPFKKRSKVYLGTFKTAEEAAEAFNRTRREFDAIVSLAKKRKHETDSEAHKAGGSKSKKPAIILEEAGMLIDDRTRLFEIVVEPHSCNDNSTVTVVSSQGCNNNSNDNQIFEEEFGMGVIDSYGRLVGEYSRLDDELWLSRPGEDEEFDVNGAFFYGNGELAWDANSKPSLSS